MEKGKEDIKVKKLSSKDMKKAKGGGGASNPYYGRADGPHGKLTLSQ